MRESLKKLEFVEEAPDGTLDLWNVKWFADEEQDFYRGNAHGAKFLHIMQEFDAPFLLHHLMTAWTSLSAREWSETRHVRRGFSNQIGLAVLAAPEDVLAGEAIPKFVRRGEGRDGVLLSLPTAMRDSEGRVRCFNVTPSGDDPEDQARGRWMAYCLIHRMKATGDPGLLWAVRRAAREAFTNGGTALAVGFDHVIGEIAMRAGRAGTLYLEATYPLHREAMKARRGEPSMRAA